MTYDLFIAYVLIKLGQNYDAVRDRIKSLGIWHQFQFSLFYVSTEFTPEQAFAHVSAVLDGNDKLAVINASGGVVTTWDKPPIDAINAIWSAPQNVLPRAAVPTNRLAHRTALSF